MYVCLFGRSMSKAFGIPMWAITNKACVGLPGIACPISPPTVRFPDRFAPLSPAPAIDYSLSTLAHPECTYLPDYLPIYIQSLQRSVWCICISYLYFVLVCYVQSLIIGLEMQYQQASSDFTLFLLSMFLSITFLYDDVLTQFPSFKKMYFKEVAYRFFIS